MRLYWRVRKHGVDMGIKADGKKEAIKQLRKLENISKQETFKPYYTYYTETEKGESLNSGTLRQAKYDG